MSVRRALFVACALGPSVLYLHGPRHVPAGPPGSATQAAPTSGRRSEPQKQRFSGKVVFLQPALEGRGIPSTDEIKHIVALETTGGDLLPIIPDWRGRAFYQDKRLRDRKVELIGKRHHGVPMLQVLMIFAFNEKGERQYVDYWCDVCAIPMYEIKPCDCCQDEIRLRFQSKELPAWLNDPQDPDALQGGLPQNVPVE